MKIGFHDFIIGFECRVYIHMFVWIIQSINQLDINYVATPTRIRQ